MNSEHKIIKQRKQSLNKQNQYTYTQITTNTMNSITRDYRDSKDRQSTITGSKVRSSSSLPKHYAGASNTIGITLTQSNLMRNPNMNVVNVNGLVGGHQKSNGNEGMCGGYLIGWGQLPFKNVKKYQIQRNLSQDTKSKNIQNSYKQSLFGFPPIKLAKNVLKYSLGQKHIVYINNKYQSYGIGSSIFGQLGYYQPEQNTYTNGQYNEQANPFSNTPIPILEQLMIQDVFCTPYCTFFITNRDQVYGCGLNNRGQLGIKRYSEEFQSEGNHDCMATVSTPMRINSLSKKPLIFQDNIVSNTSNVVRSSSRTKCPKIQSYALAQRAGITLTQQSKLFTQKSQGGSSDIYLNTFNLNTQFSQQNKDDKLQINQIQPSILDDNQFITAFSGGPYHTIALSNRGRVFYTGNIYKKSSILNDQYTKQFTELNLKKIGRVDKIKSGLTCIGLLNSQGNVFLLGALSENIICDEPYNIGINCVVDFGITKDKIYVTTSLGDVWVLLLQRKSLKSYKLKFNKIDKINIKIVQIQCGMDYCLFINEKGQVYADGNNYANVFGGQIHKKVDKQNQYKSNEKHKRSGSTSQFNQQSVNKINFNKLQIRGIKANLNFVIGISNKLINHQQNDISKQNIKNQMNTNKNEDNNQNLVKRIQQLEKQNKLLKDLVKQDNQSTKAQKNNIGNQSQCARKKDLTSSSNLGQTQMTKKISNQEGFSNSKFDMNMNISEKVMTKARKFDSSMQIPFQQIQLGKQISQGGYGIIYKAVWRKTTVAVKIFKIDTNSENSIKDFVSQCHAMQALRHPNIVMFLGACTKPPNFAIVLEYCQGGTLWSILQKSGELSWELRRRFALDTARGMNYLHERPTPILHRDLKSLNILLDQNKRVKLADFGWTKGLQNYMTGKIGTYQWMAPQVVSSHQYTQKADVFSFSIILWQIASREAPYRNIPGVQVAQDVLNKDLRPTIPKKTPQAFAALMKKCWVKNPQQRPSFIEIIDQLQSMQLSN